MTTARLSPAASLLRNSRLFALPPALGLSPTPASSGEVSRSDTATAPHPIRAAIETPLASLNKGDWGLKRSLPLKSTATSGTPVIRIQGGIDTAEHIADFESAADHVLTLRKLQELNLQIRLPSSKRIGEDQKVPNVFSAEFDNIDPSASSSNIEQLLPKPWPESKPLFPNAHLPDHLRKELDELNKVREAEAVTNGETPPKANPAPRVQIRERKRWRYSGPYLSGMTGMEFDSFVSGINQEQKARFREKVREHLLAKRLEQKKSEALARGAVEENSKVVVEVSDRELDDYMRVLRSKPDEFGPLLTEFLDLPEGDTSRLFSTASQKGWLYGRDTIATELYKESGPPRTHPSAGLSYIQSQRFARNDPVYGPMVGNKKIPARLIKGTASTGLAARPVVGVAGFIVPTPSTSGSSPPNWTWQPKKGGPKREVIPLQAALLSNGRVEMMVRDLPIPRERKMPTPFREAIRGSDNGRMPALDGPFGFRRREDPSRRATKMDEEVDGLLGRMMEGVRDRKA